MIFQLMQTKETPVAKFQCLSPCEFHHHSLSTDVNHISFNGFLYSQSRFPIRLIHHFLSNYFSSYVWLNRMESPSFKASSLYIFFILACSLCNKDEVILMFNTALYLQIKMTGNWLWVRVFKRLGVSEIISFSKACLSSFTRLPLTVSHLLCMDLTATGVVKFLQVDQDAQLPPTHIVFSALSCCSILVSKNWTILSVTSLTFPKSHNGHWSKGVFHSSYREKNHMWYSFRLPDIFH